MHVIFYYVMGHRANANKLTDRCKTEKKRKKKKNRRQNEQTKTRALTESPVRQPSRYTVPRTAPFSFMPQLKSILELLILPGEDYRDLLIAFFFLKNSTTAFSVQKNVKRFSSIREQQQFPRS